MSEKRIKTPSDELIIIPKEVLPRLSAASEAEVKTLLVFFASPDISISDAARSLGLTVDKVEAAVAFWRGAGIFKDGEEKKKAVSDTSSYRNYDAETLANAAENDGGFKMVCEIATEKLGKQLTKNDLSALYYLFDFVRLPSPVICGIIGYCCDKGKNSMQYIYKKAVALYEEEGIDTPEKLESYIAKREAAETNIGKIRKLFGMGDRELTANEKKTFDKWFVEKNLSFELVHLAYDKTIDNIGKINIKYMDGILNRWFESGFETPEDVESGDSSRNAGTESSFETDEFIKAALNRKFDD